MCLMAERVGDAGGTLAASSESSTIVRNSKRMLKFKVVYFSQALAHAVGSFPRLTRRCHSECHSLARSASRSATFSPVRPRGRGFLSAPSPAHKRAKADDPDLWFTSRALGHANHTDS